MKEKIMQIISEQLNISVDSLKEDTAFSDLGADSLDLFQIISAIEEEFDIEFENDDAERVKTIEDAISYIKKTVGNV